MFERDICVSFEDSKIWYGYIKNGTQSLKTQNGGNTSMESKISYFHFQNNNCLKTEKMLDKNSHRWNIEMLYCLVFI